MIILNYTACIPVLLAVGGFRYHFKNPLTCNNLLKYSIPAAIISTVYSQIRLQLKVGKKIEWL